MSTGEIGGRSGWCFEHLRLIDTRNTSKQGGKRVEMIFLRSPAEQYRTSDVTPPDLPVVFTPPLNQVPIVCVYLFTCLSISMLTQVTELNDQSSAKITRNLLTYQSYSISSHSTSTSDPNLKPRYRLQAQSSLPSPHLSSSPPVSSSPSPKPSSIDTTSLGHGSTLSASYFPFRFRFPLSAFRSLAPTL